MLKRNKSFYYIYVIICILKVDLLHASEADSVFELGVIEITSREIIDLPNTSVIDSLEIEKHGVSDLSEALNIVPGVTVQNIGQRGERLIYMRGFNSRQVPLFIDGIPVYVPYDGNIDLGRFLVNDLAEINISKGFSSVLYGPNTMGGAINLVSRRPTDKLELNVLAGLEFDRGYDKSVNRTAFNLGSNQESWYFQAGGELTDREFFRLSDDFNETMSENGGRRENSRSEDHKLNFKLGYTPNETDEYAISYYNQKGEKQTPPYAGDDPDFRTRYWRWPEYDKESIYFISKTQFGPDYFVKLKTYYDSFDNTLDSYDDDSYTTQNRPFAFQSIYDDYTYGGGIEVGTYEFDKHELKGSFSYKRDIHRETDDFDAPQERYEDRLISFGLEDTYFITDQLSLVSGISYDEQKGIEAEEFETDKEDAINLQAGMFYDYSDVGQIYATVGKRTRFPTIKDRYSFRFGSAIPNPGLQPEQAINSEIGFTSSIGNTDYGLSLFWSEISDAIEEVTIAPGACTSPPCFQQQNIGRQENKGFEVFVDSEITHKLFLHADITYIDRDNESDPEIRPLDTPKFKGFAYVEYQPIPKMSLFWNVEYQSERFSETDGSRTTDSFITSNVRATAFLPGGFDMEVGINNVTDREYEYEEGFQEPGRTFYTNFRFTY